MVSQKVAATVRTEPEQLRQECSARTRVKVTRTDMYGAGGRTREMKTRNVFHDGAAGQEDRDTTYKYWEPKGGT